jgi:hypothetical protein
MGSYAGSLESGGRFPLTRRSIVAAAGNADPEVRRQAWDVLVASYWRPVYKVLRMPRLPATQVTDFLAAARREFRRLVLERLRELTGSEREFREEARLVLGVDPGSPGGAG